MGQICDLAVRIGAEFVELSVGRVRDAGAAVVAAEAPAMEADAAFLRRAGWVR